MDLSRCERVLIVKPSSLGDVIHTLPAVASLRKALPDAQIDWLVNTEWAPLLEGNGILSGVIPFPRREFRGLPGLRRAKKWATETLSHRDYDLAIDFQGLQRSALLGKLSRAENLIGFRNAREGAHLLYDQKIRVQNWSEKHAVDRNRLLVQSLEIDTETVAFPLPPGEPLDSSIDLGSKAILLHPFSRGRGKSLSIAEVKSLCEQLAPHPVWLVGVTDGIEPQSWPDHVVDLLNDTSLPQLIHLIREAAFTISVDSGPMHLAAALSETVLAIHSWSNPKMVGPWRPRSWVWRESQIVPVSELTPTRFPEQRALRDHYDAQGHILTTSDIETLAAFTRDQIQP